MRNLLYYTRINSFLARCAFQLALATFIASVASAQVTQGVYYIIINSGTGLVLDVGGANNSAQVHQSLLNGSTTQMWTFNNVVGTSEYTIGNYSGNNSYVLDVPGGSPNNGIVIQLWSANGFAQQNWELVAVPGTAFFNIRNVDTGLVLDIPSDSTANGTPVQQWVANNNAQQNWKLLPYSAGAGSSSNAVITYSIINVGTGLVLQSDPGRPLYEQTPSGDLNQQWQFFPGTSSPYFTIGVTGLPNGVNNTGSGNSYAVIDVPSGATNNGAQIQTWTPAKTPQQNWQIVPIPGTQAYTLVNQRSGLVLDATNDSNTPGTRVQQWQSNGGVAQQWMLVSSIQAGGSGIASGCSRSTCSSQCSKANSTCTYGNGNKQTCAQNAIDELNSCVASCGTPGSQAAAYCAHDCIVYNQNALDACQQGSQNVSQACSAEQQSCQSNCSQCPNP